MKTLFVALRATLVASLFLWLWSLAARAVRPWDAQLGHTPAWTRLPGVLLMLAGGAVALTCVVLFVARGRGTPAPFDPPRRFVASGLYRYSRNPMYLGGFLTLCGYGLYEQSPSILLLACAGLVLAHLFVVLLEEPGLRTRFGPDYEAYLRTVPRWL
jgi:protein-S-isoprenylcysteine O-methyltransferase Ste14